MIYIILKLDKQLSLEVLDLFIGFLEINMQQKALRTKVTNFSIYFAVEVIKEEDLTIDNFTYKKNLLGFGEPYEVSRSAKVRYSVDLVSHLLTQLLKIFYSFICLYTLLPCRIFFKQNKVTIFQKLIQIMVLGRFTQQFLDNQPWMHFYFQCLFEKMLEKYHDLIVAALKLQIISSCGSLYMLTPIQFIDN